MTILRPYLLQPFFFSFGDTGNHLFFFTYSIVFRHRHVLRVHLPLARVCNAICKEWVHQGALADLRLDRGLFTGHPSSSLPSSLSVFWSASLRVCEYVSFQYLLFGSFSSKKIKFSMRVKDFLIFS